MDSLVIIVLVLSVLNSVLIKVGFDKQKKIQEQLRKQENLPVLAQQANDLFEKKALCQKYKNQIIKEMKEEDELANVPGSLLQVQTFEKIFFSSKENTCLYVGEKFSNVTNQNKKYLVLFIFVKNALSGEELVSFKAADYAGFSPDEKSEIERQIKMYE